MNHFSLVHRLVKVERLVDCIDRHMCGGALVIDPHADALQIAKALRKWGPSEWASCAVLAAVRPPSSATVELVIRRYEERAGEPSVSDSGVYQRRSAS